MDNIHDFPCRVSADLRAKQHREDQFVPVEFNSAMEEHVRAILHKEQHALIKPIMGLLESYWQIQRAQKGFGAEAFNHKKALEWLEPDLNRLHEACAVLFAESDR